jgi:anti-sigma regulatory factor (Ser/Thr protein kinase)
MAKILLAAKIANLHAAMDFVVQAARQQGFDEDNINQIQLAFEEAVVNVINYAYPDKNGDMEISCLPKEKGLQIEIVDSGIPFDPLSLPEPDLNAPIEKRKIGGLGVYMIRKIMNEVSYKRENGRNILIMVKY